MFRIQRLRPVKPGTETRTFNGKPQARMHVNGKMQWVDLNDHGNAIVLSPDWYVNHEGKRVRLARDRVSAEAALLRLRTQTERVTNGLLLPEPAKGGLAELIADYAANLARQGCRPATVARRPFDISRTLAQMAVKDLAGLRRIDTLAFHRWAQTSALAPRSTFECIQTIRSFMKWLGKSGYVARIPDAPGRMPTPSRPKRELTREEEVRLMAATTPKRATIYRLMLAIGCRAGATGSLQVRYFELDRPMGPVVILRAENAKTKRGLAIPLPMGLVPEIRKIISNKQPNELAFGVMGSSLSRMFSLDLVKAGVARKSADGYLCLHCLRHTFASRALRSGASPAIVARVGGWNSVAVLMKVYSHLLPEDGRAMVDQIFKN